MSDRRDLIVKKIKMKTYLGELSALVGGVVPEDALLTLDETQAIKHECTKMRGNLRCLYDKKFNFILSSEFISFINVLDRRKSVRVYVWTPRSSDCGAFLGPKISEIKFDFDFSINKEGVFVFITKDCTDRLLIDFYEDGCGEKMVKIETQGEMWATV